MAKGNWLDQDPLNKVKEEIIKVKDKVVPVLN
jgi:hypothetical protein